jgi:hypothetical protein
MKTEIRTLIDHDEQTQTETTRKIYNMENIYAIISRSIY